MHAHGPAAAAVFHRAALAHDTWHGAELLFVPKRGCASSLQALICSLIFALGKYPVPGVIALGSSVIAIVILVIVGAEAGRRTRPSRSLPGLSARRSHPTR